jgi:serine/threonine protein kinase
MSLKPGTRLGPYEILSLLGAGGMGEVYKAHDTRLDRIVALKVSNENFNERFEREARAIAALNHSKVTAPDPSGEVALHYIPQFLPDGRHFVYFTQGSRPEKNGTFAGSLDSPPDQRGKLILSGTTNTLYARGPRGGGYLLFRREGALMAQAFDPASLRLAGEPFQIAPQVSLMAGIVAASVSDSGVLSYSANPVSAGLSRLAWFDRSGKRLYNVGSPGIYPDFALSPDEKQAGVQPHR